MFQCQPICGKEKKEKEKNMPFLENNVVKVNFLDFQANLFPLLFKPNNRKFPMSGFQNKVVLMVYFLF
jgi:hypothetical protein